MSGLERTNEFIARFREMQKAVHQNAIAHGWWDEARNDGEMLCLIHSELSEALEALRKGNPRDEHCPEYTNHEIELADCIIRIMDYAHARGYRLPEAIVAKCRYNEGRPYKHGKGF